AAVRDAERIATVRVTYAEARAAFARQRRERAITARDLRTLVRALDEDWASLAVVEVTEASVRAAGDLAERHALRAYDALQLAAAVQLHAEGGTVASCRASYARSEEHTSELQSRSDLVCRLLLE